MSETRPVKISREMYEQQCKRRFGTANPERMDVPVWEWMVRRSLHPYTARDELGLEGHYDNNPDWTLERFGMTRTPMPDGRIICIAGEHEDWYDPDFCIYNDVIVLRPEPGAAEVTPDSGSVEIYGYPHHVLPPTDFHSATLVGDRIYIIGRLGYEGTRAPDQTPVFALDTSTYRVEPIRTHGRPPGWVYRHHASYDAAVNSITVRGGMIDTGEPNRKTESPSYSAYRLRLDDFTWQLIAERETHRRFLFEAEESASELREPTAETFRPGQIACDVLRPEDRGIWVYGISVQGVRITFEAFCNEIRTLVEGDLPPDLVRRLLSEVSNDLQRDTGARWTIREVEGWTEP
jgi:hypothetical protein